MISQSQHSVITFMLRIKCVRLPVRRQTQQQQQKGRRRSVALKNHLNSIVLFVSQKTITSFRRKVRFLVWATCEMCTKERKRWLLEWQNKNGLVDDDDVQDNWWGPFSISRQYNLNTILDHRPLLGHDLAIDYDLTTRKRRY